MKELVKKADVAALQDIANRLRIHSVAATNASKSGHPTSCSSLAEIMSVLFFNVMRYTPKEPRHKSADRLVLSKGHAAPILYAAWAEAGLFDRSELLNLRKIDSDLEGHPTPRLNFVDVATGSLGQGLSIACGMAYVGKFFDRASYRVYCIVGDGESCEGSIWEALHFAGHYELNNLCVIFDVNRLGQSGPTSLEHNMDVYKKRLEAFGFDAQVVDGHDVEVLCQAFATAAKSQTRPTALLAQTFKGKGFPNIEDLEDWHGKPLMDKGLAIIKELEAASGRSTTQLRPLDVIDDAPAVDISNIRLSSPPNYSPGDSVATRLAYGVALSKIAANNERVIGLDGDTKNSTYSDKLRAAFPDRYVECYIAEQNLAGVAVGAACRDRTVAFASTFAAFLTRAFDQVRMAAISQSNVNFAGSHCGISIGEDGPSQMGLEDIAMFRSVPTCTVFYPSDAVSAERAVELAANTRGICFIRTSRPATPILYGNDEPFEVGQSKVVRQSAEDVALVIGAGVTLHEAVTAANQLETENGVRVRILDPFTIKPLDAEGIRYHARQCGGNVVVVEDHYPEGGIGEAVMNALAEDRGVCIKHLAVREIPKSGPPKALLEKFGINAAAIVKAVTSFL